MYITYFHTSTYIIHVFYILHFHTYTYIIHVFYILYLQIIRRITVWYATGYGSALLQVGAPVLMSMQCTSLINVAGSPELSHPPVSTSSDPASTDACTVHVSAQHSTPATRGAQGGQLAAWHE